MDQNKKDKVRDFFRKEGFYFVLFICLCVIATVAAFTMKKNASKVENKPTNEFTLNIEDDSKSTSNIDKQNAERVENNQEVDVADTNTAVESEGEVALESQEEPAEEAPVVAGTNTEVIFELPLEGTVEREYKAMIEVSKDDTTQVIRTRRGIDIAAPVGTIVKSVAEGQVENVSNNTEDGTFIVITHANGLKTKYTNLDPEVNVAVGDIVKAGTEIGKVGNSSSIFTAEICGDVLNLQVENANGEQVDPAKYFNF